MQRSLRVFANMAYSYARCLLVVVTLYKHLVVALYFNTTAQPSENQTSVLSMHCARYILYVGADYVRVEAERTPSEKAHNLLG